MEVRERVVRFSVERPVGFSLLGPAREVKMEPGDADFLASFRCHPRGLQSVKDLLGVP